MTVSSCRRWRRSTTARKLWTTSSITPCSAHWTSSASRRASSSAGPAPTRSRASVRTESSHQERRSNHMAIETLPRTERGGYLAYDDLRDWIKHSDAMGLMKYVNGANREEDIGQATDVLHHTEGSPAALFDNIPGYDPGYRVVVNCFNTHKRIAFTL